MKLKKNMTIDDLAVMMAKGFETMATKEDLKQFATKEDLGNLENRLSNQIEALDTKLSNQINDVKDTVDRIEENDVLDIQVRLRAVEKDVRILKKSA